MNTALRKKVLKYKRRNRNTKSRRRLLCNGENKQNGRKLVRKMNCAPIPSKASLRTKRSPTRRRPQRSGEIPEHLTPQPAFGSQWRDRSSRGGESWEKSHQRWLQPAFGSRWQDRSGRDDADWSVEEQTIPPWKKQKIKEDVWPTSAKTYDNTQERWKLETSYNAGLGPNKAYTAQATLAQGSSASLATASSCSSTASPNPPPWRKFGRRYSSDEDGDGPSRDSMVTADVAQQSTSKFPPYWSPELERKGYPFRIWSKDVLLWCAGT